MADKYFAYSTFNTKVNEWGRVEETIKPGEEVTQAALGVNDDDWAEYIKLGVVSKVPYPEEAIRGESPNEAFNREDLALARGELSEDEAKRVKARQAIQAEEANNFQAEATALASAGDDEGATKVIEEGAKAAGTLVLPPKDEVKDK